MTDLAWAAPIRTLYVATNGDDTADGTTTRPWRTLQHAAQDVQPGDLIIVRPGRYVGFVLGWDGPQNGTAANPITFRGESGAIIDTRNNRTADGINLEGAAFIVIEGFVTSRSQIEHGIYVSNACVNPIVRNNQVWGNAGNGIHMNGDVSQGENGLILNALVEKNVIYDNGRQGGSGINADGVQNSRFLNNLLYNNHASGISLYKIDGAGGSTNNVIAHNTISMASDGRWALNIQNGSTGTSVVNNILHNNHSFRGSIDISADSLSNFSSNYNVVMDRFIVDNGPVQNLAQWRQQTGQDRNSVVATPTALFVNPAGNDYQLLSNSPARDKGVVRNDVREDRIGTLRPVGPTSDIGAYEFRSTAGTTPPPTPTNLRIVH
ncbi:MAG: right-handed parallel beta-helix repeat-containing protein [Nitrospirota bacterium]